MFSQIKDKIFQIIQPDHGDSLASRIFDWLITALILFSFGSVFVATFGLSESQSQMLQRFDAFVSVVFTVEYLLRIWTADRLYPGKCGFKARVKFVCSFAAIIDLVAFLPFWLPMILPSTMLSVRALRLVRILRLLKMNRYSESVAAIGAVIVGKRRELLGSVIFVFLLMMISSLVIYSVEHDAQPEVFKNGFSGFWWAVATLTTVGYGDIYPVTVIGRLFGAVIALLGIGMVGIPTGIIASGMVERISKNDDEEKEPEAREEFAYCPHCGKKLR